MPETIIFCWIDIFNSQTFFIGMTRMATSNTTPIDEFTRYHILVLIHTGFGIITSQNAWTGEQEKMPTKALSIPHPMHNTPIIFTARLIPRVGKSDRKSRRIDTLITERAMA